MNKIIFTILLLIFVLFLFGCGQKQVSDTNVDTVEDNLDVQGLEDLDAELVDTELNDVGSDLDLLLNEI